MTKSTPKPSSPVALEPLLTVQEVAELFGIGVAQVRILARRREIASYRLGAGPKARRRFRPSDIEEYLKKCRQDPMVWKF